MLWYSNLPCFDVYGVTSEYAYEKSLLKACYWKGKPIPCAAIFKSTPTDRGMCCSFKMKPLNEIFAGNTFVNLAMEMQEFDKQSSLVDTSLPNWYDGKSSFAQPGILNYLFTLIFDLKTLK